MKDFEVVDSQNKIVGTVQARSYSDAFFEVDKKYGESIAINCKLRRIDCCCQAGWTCPNCSNELRDKIQWIEQRNKELLELLDLASGYIPRGSTYREEKVAEKIEEQLKKSE